LAQATASHGRGLAPLPAPLPATRAASLPGAPSSEIGIGTRPMDGGAAPSVSSPRSTNDATREPHAGRPAPSPRPPGPGSVEEAGGRLAGEALERRLRAVEAALEARGGLADGAVEGRLRAVEEAVERWTRAVEEALREERRGRVALEKKLERTLEASGREAAEESNEVQQPGELEEPAPPATGSIAREGAGKLVTPFMLDCGDRYTVGESVWDTMLFFRAWCDWFHGLGDAVRHMGSQLVSAGHVHCDHRFSHVAVGQPGLGCTGRPTQV